jgi:hypothetical protein
VRGPGVLDVALHDTYFVLPDARLLVWLYLVVLVLAAAALVKYLFFR